MSINEIANEAKQYINLSKDDIYLKLSEKFPSNTHTIKLFMYNNYKYIYTEDISSTPTLTNNRDGQELFRKKVINRYKNCIITGYPETVCQACHIVPHSECNSEDKYNVNNGLLLRADLHILFDKKLLQINPETLKINLLDKSLQEYIKYDGLKLNIHLDSIYYLKKYYGYSLCINKHRELA
jgi:hypothetical protein